MCNNHDNIYKATKTKKDNITMYSQVRISKHSGRADNELQIGLALENLRFDYTEECCEFLMPTFSAKFPIILPTRVELSVPSLQP